MNNLRTAPASLRNSEPILQVLCRELADRHSLLEIGSGTGQHAVYFAPEFPQLTWQTSDLAENHDDIRAHIAAAKLRNVEAPLELDVRNASIDGNSYDVVYTCNTMHIMSFAAVRAMISLVGDALCSNGVFCGYGPFRVNGEFSTDSNRAFDRSLRERKAEMAIRDLETIDELAHVAGMSRVRRYAMPANNLLLVWKKL